MHGYLNVKCSVQSRAMYLLQINDRGHRSQGMLLDYLPVKNCFKASIKYAMIPGKSSLEYFSISSYQLELLSEHLSGIYTPSTSPTPNSPSAHEYEGLSLNQDSATQPCLPGYSFERLYIRTLEVLGHR
jgi:hypothetical protein